MNKLNEYLENLCKEVYYFNDEDTTTFIETVTEYVKLKNLTSLNEVEIYIDGLLTNLDINTGAL